MGKLPYIPDKRLYAAVMGACSWIRETGYFNKACHYYANKYDVDEDDVKRYVRIAQSNGQKQANANRPKRKYHWYVIEFSVMNGIDPYFYQPYAQYEVRKAMSADNAKYATSEAHDRWGYSDSTSLDTYFGRVEEFDTESEARECAKEWALANKEVKDV